MTWIHNGIILKEDHREYERLKTGEFVIIKAWKYFHDGEYTCRFENNYESVEDKVSFFIQPTVDIVDMYKDTKIIAKVGELIKLSCEVVADPTVTVTIK